jgi:hypothetical protein
MKNKLVWAAIAAGLALGPALGSAEAINLPRGMAWPVGKRRRGKPNPAGTKVARRIMKARGLPWNGEVFHGGELTALNNARRLKRAALGSA